MWSCEVHGLQPEPVKVVPATEVEHIVGQQRWHFEHIGIVSGGTVTILHSHQCRRTLEDLRECEFSRALARGVDYWAAPWPVGRPLILEVRNGDLHPALALHRTYVPAMKVS